VPESGCSGPGFTEVVAHGALNKLSTYVNLIAGTEIDFPEAPKLPEPGIETAALGEGSGSP